MFVLPPPCDTPQPGSAFAQSIRHLGPGPSRDSAVLAQFLRGNIPAFMRQPVEINLAIAGHTATVYTLPDYLCVGVDEDFFRFPLSPLIAQLVCDSFHASFPTRKLVNAIWRAAQVKLAPAPWGPPYDASMLSTQRFWEHNERIEQQLIAARAPRGAFVAGHKKDIVLTPHLERHPDRVAIYGWHQLSGQPIQALNPVTHEASYADYSHGCRPIASLLLVDSVVMPFAEVLAGPLWRLVSDEGPSSISRQPRL